MPKQEFNDLDLWAAAICFSIFLLFVLITSCTCINYCFVKEDDELTKMEIWGYNRKLNWKLGPHSKKALDRKMAERLMADE